MSCPRPSSSDLPCMLCGRAENCIEKYGEKKTYAEHGLTLHYYCLLLSSGIWQRGEEHEGIYGFLVSDIKKELNRARKLRCSVCKLAGASIGCVVPRCKRSYHYPCGQERQCIFQFMENYCSFCWDHLPVQNSLQKEMRDSSPCMICLENVPHIPSYHILRGPCCKGSWYHRDCLQYQALSAGLFFFRCTVCNNRDLFQKEMLRMGIHIPERDASWELEENAFEELLVRYRRCDAKACVCQFGREYDQPESKWEIVCCQSCGSSGTHICCSSLKQGNPTWECLDCRRLSCTPEKQARPMSSNLSCNRRFGIEQPSPKSLRRSMTPKRMLKHIQMQNRPILDILQELRSQIQNSVYTLRVNRKSLWTSTLRCFRSRKFSPSSSLQLEFTGHHRNESQQADMSLSEYFKLLLDDIQDSNLFEGAEQKNLSLKEHALQDNLYFEAGRMLAVSLVHGGPAPGFFSQTLFACLVHDPHHIQPVLEDVTDPDVLEAITTIQSCQRIQELNGAFVRYLDYLQQAGALQVIESIKEKTNLVRKMLAYQVIHRVRGPLESFKQGLKTLGVLEKIQAYPTAFCSILCMKPEKLTAKAMAELFIIANDSNPTSTVKNNATNLWEQYLKEAEDGEIVVSLENILTFATGLDSIPPAGFEPQPSIVFHYRSILPTAQKHVNCMHLPGRIPYNKFRQHMDEAICTAVYNNNIALKRMLNFNVPLVKNNTGEPVWKVLIYDRFGQDIISPLLSVKELRDMGVTLHLLLHSDRDAIPDVPAVYFVIPTEENVDRICQDLRTGLYESYYLNFISAISRSKLEDIASAALTANTVAQVSKCHSAENHGHMLQRRNNEMKL
ncbi:G2/M phase-specific E3 ubiquitin-protein ligase [Gastrophryne carolinensis]